MGGASPFDFSGEHISVRDAQVPDAPLWPRIYFGGSSPRRRSSVAARHADVYLTWGEPPALVAEKLDRVRALASDAEGRALRLRHPPARRSRATTSEEAWAAADRLLAELDPAQIEQAQENLRSSSSEGQRRMLALHGGSHRRRSRSTRTCGPASGLVRGGAGTALVGSYEEVADRIAEYHALGLDEFILSRLSPPRGGLPRRRGRPPDPARARPARRTGARAGPRGRLPPGRHSPTAPASLLLGAGAARAPRAASLARCPVLQRSQAQLATTPAAAPFRPTSAATTCSTSGVRRSGTPIPTLCTA